jgi:alkaline phosphatase/alkaline phosphatase D
MIASLCWLAVSLDAMAAQGMMVGEVTPSSAFVQVRLTASGLVDGDVPGAQGVVKFILSAEGSSSFVTQVVRADAEGDFIARAAFSGLSPETLYECRSRIGASLDSLRPGPSARFRTLGGAASDRDVRFVVVTGMNYAKYHAAGATPGADKNVGFPALAAILERQPDFLVGTGDNVYYDRPAGTRARTVGEMRQKWHEQFVQSRFVELFASVPAYWMVDDHDYRINDCDNTGGYQPSPERAQKVMFEQLPMPSDKPYRTLRVSRDLQIWITENRMYRSPNKAPDGPDKTIWGAEQKEWLKRTLLASDAKQKLLISPTPMIGPDDAYKKDNHANHGGFRYERDEFFFWLKESGVADGFAIICGDRHWQYHSVDPSGIEEFSCGALVDANARLGRVPGDKNSTDPDALIVQPYLQKKASGGFLEVVLSGGELAVAWFDENGVLLHRS